MSVMQRKLLTLGYIYTNTHIKQQKQLALSMRSIFFRESAKFCEVRNMDDGNDDDDNNNNFNNPLINQMVSHCFYSSLILFWNNVIVIFCILVMILQLVESAHTHTNNCINNIFTLCGGKYIHRISTLWNAVILETSKILTQVYSTWQASISTCKKFN